MPFQENPCATTNKPTCEQDFTFIVHAQFSQYLEAFGLKVPMKRNFLFFLTKEHKKLEDCRLPFLNILFGLRVT